MSEGPQFTLFSHKGGPNGWCVFALWMYKPANDLWVRKVAVILDELGLTYETTFLDFQNNEQKAESHTKYNPNGRIPTIIDHKNNDFALW